MGIRSWFTCAAVACGLASLLVPTVSHADEPSLLRHPVYGGAEAFFGDCPDIAELPPAGTVCSDSYVIFWRGYSLEGGGSVAVPNAPWTVVAETYRVEFTGADEPIVTTLRSGFIEFPDDAGDASVDRVDLQAASLEAQIPMTDGSTFDFAGTWHATSDRFLFGNAGPSNGDLPRHLVDRCTTFNALAHQKYVFASMSGTLNGEAVHSYTASGSASIFNNNFRYIFVPHGGCT
jgi:hypothetical protein